MSIKISNAELQIMRILWREQRPVTFTEIRTELMGKMGWNKSTVQTLVTRLRDKGAIDARFQNVLLYTPAVTKQEYMETEEQDFLDRLFDGSAVSFVSGLCRKGKLGKEDIDALKALFETEDEEQ